MSSAIIKKNVALLFGAGGAPGAVVPVSVQGAAFHCKEASASFEMSYNEGEWFAMDKGLGFRLPDVMGADGRMHPQQFKRLQFRLPAGAAANSTLEFYAGNLAMVTDSRLNSSASNSLAISPADVLAITPVANAGVTHAHLYQTNVGDTIYAAKRSLAILNTGAANITIDGVALRPNHSISFSVERMQDRLANITINTLGSEALISWTA